MQNKIREETPPGSILEHAYLIKELYCTCIMAHQSEALTDNTELLTWWTWFTVPGFEPATIGSVAYSTMYSVFYN